MIVIPTESVGKKETKFRDRNYSTTYNAKDQYQLEWIAFSASNERKQDTDCIRTLIEQQIRGTGTAWSAPVAS